MKNIFNTVIFALFLIVFSSCEGINSDKRQSFIGQVKESYESSCLVEVTDPQTSHLQIEDQVVVTTSFEGCPQYAIGDCIEVEFDGKVAESYPMAIHNVFSVSIKDIAHPTTNLEFWIAENVDNVDWSKYQKKYGMMGGQEYYGTGYVPTLDEYGQQVDPEYCVIYTVTSYPDYADKTQHITDIYITDPQIEFYGITLNSSFEEFERLAQIQGFSRGDSNEYFITMEKGKYSISKTRKDIRIRVEVENKTGMIF